MDCSKTFMYTACVLMLCVAAGCPEFGPTGFARKKGSPHQRLGWKAADFFNDAGALSLCKAIEAKDAKEIERLVKSGVNVNAKGRGNMTPLLWAFPMGEKVFEKMLQLGADPNVKLTDRVWPFCFEKGKSVMSACASPDITGRTAPIHDQFFYDADMENYLKLMLAHGGNPNLPDEDGETPIFSMWLCRPRDFQQIRMLLDAGADINHRNSRGLTPAIAGIGQNSAYVLFLLNAEADYRIVDNNGSDLILWMESTTRSLERDLRERPRNNDATKVRIAALKPLSDWLSNEGVDWQAARAALNSPETKKNLKNLPADYKHRPWLPQRPTLKKPDAKAKKP